MYFFQDLKSTGHRIVIVDDVDASQRQLQLVQLMMTAFDSKIAIKCLREPNCNRTNFQIGSGMDLTYFSYSIKI